MEITGEQRILIGRDEIWRALNDPEVLKDCIPGCEAVNRVGDNEYHVAMNVSVGPVKARFKGKMMLTDLNPPHSYRLAFEGQGGAAGFGKGEARVNLRGDSVATLMSYSAKAHVGGKLAQVGARLIDGVAKRIADEFFTAFNARIAPGSGAVLVASSGGRRNRVAGWGWLWIAIIAAVVVTVYVVISH